MNETIQNNIKNLPAEVKAVWQSDQKINTLFELAQKHDLYEGDIKPLINEVDLILLNLEDLELLPINLERELGINPITASKLAEDITSQIFAPIIESIQKMADERRKEEDNNLPMLPEEHELMVVKPTATESFLPPLTKKPEEPASPTSATTPIPTPAPKPVEPTPEPIKKPFTPPKPAPPYTPSILDTRLGSSINLPPEKMDMTDKKNEGVNKKNDPYREPI